MFLITNTKLFRIIMQHSQFFAYLLIAIFFVIVFESARRLFSLNNSDAISLLNALSSILIVGIGVYEINGWKRKNHIERKIKASEDFLLLFYRCIDAIRHTTSPFTPMPENVTIVNFDCIENVCDFKINMLNSFDCFFSEMLSRRHEFRLILGKKHEKITIEIVTIRSTLDFFIKEYKRNSAESIRLRNEAAMHEQSSVDGEMLRDKCLQSAKQFEEKAKEFEPVIWGRDSSCVTKRLEELEKEVQSMQAQYIQY